MRIPEAVRWSRLVGVGDGCWPWLGAKDRRGYGRFYARGRVAGAHRFSLELFGQAVPRESFVCHRCDNPGCVRPDHLFVGSPQANVDDMIAKGRANYRKRLTRARAEDIRRVARSAAPSLGALAARFGVSRSTVSNILLGQTWPDGSAPIHIDGTGPRHPRSKLTAGDVAEIRRLRADGMLFRDIAARFSVTKVTARQAALGLSYRRT